MEIEIFLEGFSHDGISYPHCLIQVNDMVLFDGEIVENKTINLNLDIEEGSHKFSIRHYGKMFGENRVWHTVSKDGVIKDRYLNIKQIKFDKVSIQSIWHFGKIHNLFNQKQIDDFKNQNVLPPHDEKVEQGYDCIRMSFNGSYDLEFDYPCLDWIILKKIPLHKIQGRSKESSLTTVVNWKLDYVSNISHIDKIFLECKDLLKRIP